MLSNWTPRAPGTQQRRNPGIYSAPNPRPKRAGLDSVEELNQSSRPNTECSLGSGGYPETPRSDRIDHSFLPANDPPRGCLGNYPDRHLGFRETADNTPTTERRWQSGRSIESARADYWSNMPPPRTTGSLRDAPSGDQGRSQEQPRQDPGFEYLDMTLCSPTHELVGVAADDLPCYTIPSQEGKYSDNETPSTVVPDSYGNSSDSDAPPTRRGFSFEESPEGSSDSDAPASTVQSLAPPSSEELLTSSSDEAPSSPELTARVVESQHPQPRHPLAIIGWVGELPLDDDINDSLAGVAELLSPHRSKSTCRVQSARNSTQTAKTLSRVLDSELRDLEDEMSELTQDLMAIKRTIPPRELRLGL